MQDKNTNTELIWIFLQSKLHWRLLHGVVQVNNLTYMFYKTKASLQAHFILATKSEKYDALRRNLEVQLRDTAS
jgi:hypothetical protein